jgi:subtilisin-like proprotein convertase family protein
MKHRKHLFRQTFLSLGSLLLILALGGQSALPAFNDKTPNRKTQKSVDIADHPTSETSIIPAPDFDFLKGLKTGNTANGVPSGGVDLGEESEPNDTAATADALTGNDLRIKGNIVPNADVDFYSFTAAAGDNIFAALMTSWDASASQNSILEVIGTDGTTVLETDLDDGTFGGTSSTISGFTIPAAGTYFLRVRQNSATAQIRPYELYMAKRTGSPTAETESNNTPGTANPLTPSRWMSGTINPAADMDFYSVALNAGDTVYLSLNLDPERDAVQWNGRLGFALFGNPPADQILVANDNSTGSATNPLSEAFFFTVKDSGTYYIYVDEPAAAGGATFTYNVTASIFPALPATSCTTYTSTDVPQTISSGAPPITVVSTLNVPATAERINSVRVLLGITHTFMQDLDIHLISPSNNDNGLVTDVGASTTGGAQTSMNWWIDDNAAIPPGFALTTPFRIKPELNYRLSWFNGENPSGTWQLVVRDDASADGGSINNWSLEICTEPASMGQVLYSETFDADDGGYTHSGTADEWQYGVPNTPATTTSPAVAPFLNCSNNSAGCWKTDLVGTYNASSNQDLFSPILNLTQFSGTIQLEWAMRYQMESATFDHAFVEVQDVNNPANNRIVWQFLDATMSDTVGSTPTVNIGESAGWGVYKANISDFSNKVIQLRFHLDGDTTVQLGGLAIDDVLIRGIAIVAANVGVSGRVIDVKGNAISRAFVTLTGSNGIPRTVRTNTFGYYRFDTVEVGNSYILNAAAKGYTFAPRVITVQDEITDADMVALE